MFLSLPTHFYSLMFSYAGVEQFHNYRLVCRKWKEMTDSHEIWREMAKKVPAMELSATNREKVIQYLQNYHFRLIKDLGGISSFLNLELISAQLNRAGDPSIKGIEFPFKIARIYVKRQGHHFIGLKITAEEKWGKIERIHYFRKIENKLKHTISGLSEFKIYTSGTKWPGLLSMLN